MEVLGVGTSSTDGVQPYGMRGEDVERLVLVTKQSKVSKSIIRRRSKQVLSQKRVERESKVE